MYIVKDPQLFAQRYIRNTLETREKKGSERHWKQRRQRQRTAGRRLALFQGWFNSTAMFLTRWTAGNTRYVWVCVCAYAFNASGCHCVKLAKIAFCGFRMCGGKMKICSRQNLSESTSPSIVHSPCNISYRTVCSTGFKRVWFRVQFCHSLPSLKPYQFVPKSCSSSYKFASATTQIQLTGVPFHVMELGRVTLDIYSDNMYLMGGWTWADVSLQQPDSRHIYVIISCIFSQMKDSIMGAKSSLLRLKIGFFI